MWQCFDEIPLRATFSDRYGRTYTKTHPLSAELHGVCVNGFWRNDFDTSREYEEMDDDELDTLDVFDAAPYHLVDA